MAIKNITEAKKLIQDHIDYIDYKIELEDFLAEPNYILSEIADSNVDVYKSNLWTWAGEHGNYEYVEDAIHELGMPESDGKPDLTIAIMQGQYTYNEKLLREAFEEMKDEIEI